MHNLFRLYGAIVSKKTLYFLMCLLYLMILVSAVFLKSQKVSASTFSNFPIESFPTLSSGGEVLATAQATDGSLYVGGYFTNIGGISRNSLARILPDGTVDPAFNPNVSGNVLDIKLDEANSLLYITGQFSTINGSIARTNFAVVDTDTGLATDIDIRLNAAGRAVDINSDGSVVYVGGEFTEVNRKFSTADEIAIDANGNIFVLERLSQLIYKFDSTGELVTSWGSWGIGNGEFNYVRNIALDSLGNIYTLEGSSLGATNRVQKFDNNGNYITQWGSTGSGNGQFDSPYGIGIDSGNNVYIADTANNRIQKFDSNGNYISQFGSFGSGNGQFDQPRGIAIDSNDDIFIADSSNSRIQKFDSSSVYITQWGSVGTNPGEFNFPSRLFVDGTSNVYVLDQSSRVQKFNSVGAYILQWQAPNAGNVTTALTGDSSNVYVGFEINSSSGMLWTVQKFDYSGSLVSQFDAVDHEFEIAAFNTASGNVTSFNAAINLCSSGGSTVHDIVYDSSGDDLYVAGHFMGFDGVTIRSLARLDPATGVADVSFNPDIMSTTGAYGFDQCSEVYDVVLHNNAIYAGGNFNTVNGGVARNNLASFSKTDGTVNSFNPDVNSTVYSLAHDGLVTLYAGGSFDTVNGDQARTEIAAFDTTSGIITGFNPQITTVDTNPIGPTYTVYTIHVGNNGKLFVGGTFDHVRGDQRFGLAAFVAAECNYEPFIASATVPPVFERSFNTDIPHRMATDSNGNVYVIDTTNNQVDIYDPLGALIDSWGTFGYGPGQFDYPYSIGVDGSNYVYVYDDTGRLQKFSSDGNYMSEWEPNYMAYDMAVDSNNNLYLLNSSSSIVEVYSSEGVYINQWGSFGTGQGQFGYPSGIAIDSSNNVYIVEQGNDRVQKLDINGGFIAEWGSLGVNNGQFTNPNDIAVDSNGDVYVVDVNVNGRIQKFSSEGDYLTQFGSHGIGDGQFVYDVGEGESYVGVTIDLNNNLYTADYYANRIQKFDYVELPDEDGDNIGDIEESLAPNNGDGNGDCVADADQMNVASFVSNVGGSYITIAGPSGSDFVSSSTQASSEINYSYPFGLFSFVLGGVTPGSASQFDVYIPSNENPSRFTARKYFPATQTYQNIPGATITSLNIGGHTVLHLSYSVIDGSSFDLDGVVNGSISDPAGLGVLASSTTNTTTTPSSSVARLLENTGNNIIIRLLFSVCLISLVYLLSRKRYDTEKLLDGEIIRNLGSFTIHES